MIQIIGLRIVGTEHPQQFELAYKDFEKATVKGCLITTKYGSESVLRTALKDCGVAESVIEALFQNALKCVEHG
jgi:hypothetical protein